MTKKRPVTPREVVQSWPVKPLSGAKPPAPTREDLLSSSTLSVLEVLRQAEHGECDTCGRAGILTQRKSKLDLVLRWQCVTCQEKRCESWIAVGNYCRSWPDLTPEAAWRKLPKKVKASIRFWQNERYLPYRQAFRLMLRQQAIPVYPRAGERDGLDEGGAERLRVLMREWKSREPEPDEEDPPPARSSFVEHLVGWL